MTPEPEWVDLGLPSGLLWRRFNLGATRPESYGLYFSWGNTEGHPAGAGYNFSQTVYDETPGSQLNTNLTLEHDAANVMLGGNARMPSAIELQELVDNCTSVWTSINGVNGRLFTSNINGKELFLPAAGIYDGVNLNVRGTYGGYWASTYESMTNAHRLSINSSTVDASGNYGRKYGYTIRPVKPV